MLVGVADGCAVIRFTPEDDVFPFVVFSFFFVLDNVNFLSFCGKKEN